MCVHACSALSPAAGWHGAQGCGGSRTWRLQRQQWLYMPVHFTPHAMVRPCLLRLGRVACHGLPVQWLGVCSCSHGSCCTWQHTMVPVLHKYHMPLYACSHSCGRRTCPCVLQRQAQLNVAGLCSRLLHSMNMGVDRRRLPLASILMLCNHHAVGQQQRVHMARCHKHMAW